MEENIKNGKIELRSEKVRDIIGEIPSSIVRYGLYLIILFIVGIIFCLYIIPVSETYYTEILIKSFPDSETVYSPINGKLIYTVENNRTITTNNIIGQIINKNTTYLIKSNTKGVLKHNYRNNNNIRHGEIICKIIPDTINEIYGEILVPINFIKKEYELFELNISSPFNEIIKGKITHIYPIPITKDGGQYLKAEVKLDYNENSIPILFVGKANIILKKERMINKIIKL